MVLRRELLKCRWRLDFIIVIISCQEHGPAPCRRSWLARRPRHLAGVSVALHDRSSREMEEEIKERLRGLG